MDLEKCILCENCAVHCPVNAIPKTTMYKAEISGGFNLIDQKLCMHCGLCLSVCPTYVETKRERHSPRGRIATARAIADGKIPMTREFAKEVYFCLGCLACTSACPAGVDYATIFEHLRAEAERSKLLDNPVRKVIRYSTIYWLFMDLRKLLALGWLMRLYERLGIQWLVRHSGVMKLMPKRLQELEAMTPDIPRKFSSGMIRETTLARNGKRRYRVAFLTGCAQDLIFSEINRDCVEVLAWNGCEVYSPKRQYCCGSLHAHNGETELARELAKKQIQQFPPEKFDAIISNAGGCGSHMKHYYAFLKDDPTWSERAKLWDSKVKDIHEWLDQIGILKKIPDVELIELPESNWCCGSAGIYNIVQPEMANKLLERKIANILKTGADVVANGNSGCMLQLINGMKQRHLNIRVVHPMTLLAEAYKRGQKK